MVELQRLGRRERHGSHRRETFVEGKRRVSKELSIALVGIGGYGIHYVTPMLDAVNQNSFQLVATVDPTPAACKRLADLEARRVPIYPSLDAFHDHARADLVVICTPLHLHASQTCAALGRG